MISPPLFSVHFLRFVSAAIVVLVHTLLHLQRQLVSGNYSASSNNIAGWGGGINPYVLSVSVDILFFASGFLITYLFSSGWTAKKFLLNRTTRVFPLYWILTFGFIIILLMFPNHPQHDKLTIEIIVRSVLLIPQNRPDIDIADPLPILYVGWFLSYELAFYGIFAFFLALRRSRPGLWVAAALLLLHIVALQLKTEYSYFFLYGMLGEYVFGIVFGILAAELLPYIHNRRIPYFYWLTGLACVWLLIQLILGFSLGHRALDYAIPATIIALHAIQRESFFSRSRFRQLARIGSQSCYSIYLIQVFTIPAITMVLGRIGIVPTGANLVPLCVFYVATTVVAGYVLHLSVERPVNRFLKARLLRKKVTWC